jgi:FkbM family methyltransferase|tara:strand:+ start:259 stop:1098 length:840 start_codon:yes stop_codon:yes gene_type:complete
MKVETVIKYLIKLKLNNLAYILLSCISLFLGKFSKFQLLDNDLWLQKQNKTFFCDYSPNYRLKGDDVDSFSREIFFHGYKPKKGDVCIDIGAGLGIDTRLMSQMVENEGKVFSIEATKRTFKALEVCVKYNQLQNVVASYCAISNANGPVKISQDIGHHTENKIIFDDNKNFTIVDGFTIDRYIEEHNINTIDYMKINIEGAEKYVIEAFKKIKIVKNIAISSHDFLGLRTEDKSYFTKDLVIDFLKHNNFEYYTRSTGVDYKDGWIYGINKELIDNRS